MSDRGPFELWRDVDSERRQLGFRAWKSGCELVVGKRVYRARMPWHKW